MLCRHRGLVGVVLAGVVLLGSNADVFARLPRPFKMGERYINDSGSTARCLRKYLYRWSMTSAPTSDPFINCTAQLAGDYTVVTCRDGTVGEYGSAIVWCSGVGLTGEAVVGKAEWYSDDACTTLIGTSWPVPSLSPVEDRAAEVPIDIVITHSSHGAQGTTVQGNEVYFALVSREFNERNLNETLWTCHDIATNNPHPEKGACTDNASCGAGYTCGPNPGITWQQPSTGPQSFTLNYGEQTDPPYYLGDLRPTEKVLFRFYTDLAGTYGTSPYEAFQFKAREYIPTVSEWGLVTMGVLLLAAGTVVFIRRRRAALCQA